MKTIIITAVAAIFLFWVYSHSHGGAIFAGLLIWAVILTEGNLHFRRVRRRNRARA